MFEIYCDVCGAKIDTSTEGYEMIREESGEITYHCERCLEED